MLPNLYQAVLHHVSWVTRDVTRGDLWDVFLEQGSQTFKGAAVKVFQHTQPPFGTFFMQLGDYRGEEEDRDGPRDKRHAHQPHGT